jgi:glycosyltransferase involved in cell wall biosynthesis
MSPEKTNGKPPRLRVLQVGKFYFPHVGGMETHLRTLCSKLKDVVDLSVIVANEGPKTEKVVIDGLNVTRLGRRLHIASTPICPRMAREIAAARADLVHVHLPNPWAVMAYLLSGHRGVLVASWHSDVVRQKALGQAFEMFSKMFVRRCKTIIASSANYIESSRVLSGNRDRCVAIPYGISAARFSRYDAATINALRQRFGPRIVLSAGRLVYYKGIDVLIHAMNWVDATLLIVGDGPLRNRLERKAAANPLVQRRVQFLGHVDELAPFYHASDVFALPSVARSEGFGIVQLEAMACGKPVVNTQLQSGVPFVSLDGVTGITVAPGRADELAAALNRLLHDPELRQSYGRAALQRVKTEFTVATMVRRTMQVYCDVAGNEYQVVAGRDGDAPDAHDQARLVAGN